MEIHIREVCPICNGDGCDACKDGYVHEWRDAVELVAELNRVGDAAVWAGRSREGQ